MPFLSVIFDQVTRVGNLSTRPLLPPSLNSSTCSDISSPLHSLKPPRATSKMADMEIEPSRPQRAAAVEQTDDKVMIQHRIAAQRRGIQHPPLEDLQPGSAGRRFADLELIVRPPDSQNNEFERARRRDADRGQEPALVTLLGRVVIVVAFDEEGIAPPPLP